MGIYNFFSTAMLLFIGTPEILLIAVIVLMLFGADKIPELARGFGKFIRKMKDAKSYVSKQIVEGSKDLKEEVENTFVEETNKTISFENSSKTSSEDTQEMGDSYQGPVKRQR